MSDNPAPPDYDVIERQMWRDNAQEVLARLDADEPNLLQRIETYVQRFGYTDSQVRSKIRSDPMFAAIFAMEPRRQGLHEKKAAEWLRELPTVREFATLPKSGKNALYVTSDGEVKLGRDLQNPPSKSLDFRWRTGDLTCYGMHKFTKVGGGNQTASSSRCARCSSASSSAPTRLAPCS